MTLRKEPLIPYGGKSLPLFVSEGSDTEVEIKNLCRVLPEIPIFKHCLMTQWKNITAASKFHFSSMEAKYDVLGNKYAVSLLK